MNPGSSSDPHAVRNNSETEIIVINPIICFILTILIIKKKMRLFKGYEKNENWRKRKKLK